MNSNRHPGLSLQGRQGPTATMVYADVDVDLSSCQADPKTHAPFDPSPPFPQVATSTKCGGFKRARAWSWKFDRAQIMGCQTKRDIATCLPSLKTSFNICEWSSRSSALDVPSTFARRQRNGVCGCPSELKLILQAPPMKGILFGLIKSVYIFFVCVLIVGAPPPPPFSKTRKGCSPSFGFIHLTITSPSTARRSKPTRSRKARYSFMFAPSSLPSDASCFMARLRMYLRIDARL